MIFQPTFKEIEVRVQIPQPIWVGTKFPTPMEVRDLGYAQGDVEPSN